ncbi:MAG TPA: hypothetical protein VLF59_03475 [Candidatus Saccharimonadales bacterium]|nr:hypothetical protein [Candidatus Saccharimonadales bacterium]
MAGTNLTVSQAIELLLDKMNTRRQYVGGTFAGWGGGTTGNINIQQRDMNAAITLWRERHDVSGLRQITAELHAYGNLTDTEHDQIMKVLDGDN